VSCGERRGQPPLLPAEFLQFALDIADLDGAYAGTMGTDRMFDNRGKRGDVRKMFRREFPQRRIEVVFTDAAHLASAAALFE
jgi:hypothetical protein